MLFERLSIPELIIVTPKHHSDARGYFSECYHFDRYKSGGIQSEFVQDNHSFSTKPGTLRGLHYQKVPHPQDKLIRCTRGRIVDVAVDLRASSKTYLQHIKVELSAETGQQLFVPAGFAHGFVTLENNCEVHYKVSAYYDADLDAGIAYDDPDLNICWPICDAGPHLSEKDAGLPKVSEIEPPF